MDDTKARLGLLNSVPGMVSLWGSDLRNVFANEEYAAYHGLTPQQLRGRTLAEVLGKKLFQANKGNVERVLAGHEVTFERRLPGCDGQIHDTTATYRPYIEDGQCCGFFAFVTDLSSLRLAEAARLAAQNDLQNVLNAAKEFAILAADEDGTLRLFSRGAELMLGYEAADVIGRASVLQFHDPDEITSRELELAGDGQPVRGAEVLFCKARATASERRAWTYVRADGTTLPVSLVVSPIVDLGGTITGFLGIARDVSPEIASRRKILEAIEMAEDASQSKSLFLANMSHEIRTPMNGVLGIAQLLQDTLLEPRQQEYVAMIRSAGQSLLQIINDILDFSKIEAGKIDLNPAPFAPSDLLKTLQGILGLKADEKGLRLEIQAEVTLPSSVNGDALRLQQVLVNLVGNALKFTEKGSVAVRVKAVGGQWEFRVVDTGIGLSPEQIKKLFEPFVQAEDTVTRRFGGTGLGLSISKRLVELMGGTIGVTSQVGVGSEFWFRVPLEALEPSPAPVQAADGERAPAAPARLDGRRFLLVDDAPINLVVAKAMLQNFGAQVVTATDGAQAVDCLRREPRGFDAVLMDVQMPVMNGYEATRVIRDELDLGVPVVALTAGVTAEERELCLLAGMTGFLAKPFEKGGLLTTLQSQLSSV